MISSHIAKEKELKLETITEEDKSDSIDDEKYQSLNKFEKYIFKQYQHYIPLIFNIFEKTNKILEQEDNIQMLDQNDIETSSQNDTNTSENNLQQKELHQLIQKLQQLNPEIFSIIEDIDNEYFMQLIDKIPNNIYKLKNQLDNLNHYDYNNIDITENLLENLLNILLTLKYVSIVYSKLKEIKNIKKILKLLPKLNPSLFNEGNKELLNVLIKIEQNLYIKHLNKLYKEYQSLRKVLIKNDIMYNIIRKILNINHIEINSIKDIVQVYKYIYNDTVNINKYKQQNTIILDDYINIIKEFLNIYHIKAEIKTQNLLTILKQYNDQPMPILDIKISSTIRDTNCHKAYKLAKYKNDINDYIYNPNMLYLDKICFKIILYILYYNITSKFDTNILPIDF